MYKLELSYTESTRVLTTTQAHLHMAIFLPPGQWTRPTLPDRLQNPPTTRDPRVNIHRQNMTELICISGSMLVVVTSPARASDPITSSYRHELDSMAGTESAGQKQDQDQGEGGGGGGGGGGEIEMTI